MSTRFILDGGIMSATLKLLASEVRRFSAHEVLHINADKCLREPSNTFLYQNAR